MAGGHTRNLLAAISRRRDDLFQLLAELVAIPSHVSQPDGIERVRDRIGAELAGLGFRQDHTPPVAPQPNVPRWAADVLAEGAVDQLRPPRVWRRPGENPGELLLLGDLDAALRVEAADCRLTLADGIAVGPAVADMKGGLVVLVAALDALTASGLGTPSISVVLSGDEQAGSLVSRATIAGLGATVDWCICLECARDGGFLMSSRGHIGVGQVRTTGVEAHAGSSHGSGVNAIALLVEALTGLDNLETAGEVTVTLVRGGRRRSLIPGEAVAVLDVRARSPEEWRSTEDALASLAAMTSSPARVSVELYNHRPALMRTRHTDWFLDMVRSVGKELSMEVEAIPSLAAGSSAFVDSTRIPALDGMGPVGGALMTANEFIETESLVTRAALLAGTIAELRRTQNAA